ncbi:MAG: glycosyltransferase, partial [Gemmatimonadota bacterium]
MDTVAAILVDIQRTWIYIAMLFFFGIYPVLSAVIWLTTSAIYFFGKEKLTAEREATFYALPDPAPMVSVVIPAFCEETLIRATIEGALLIDYPNYEVVVVDDGS